MLHIGDRAGGANPELPRFSTLRGHLSWVNLTMNLWHESKETPLRRFQLLISLKYRMIQTNILGLSGKNLGQFGLFATHYCSLLYSF